MSDKKSKNSNFLKKAFVCFGCGCIYPVILLILILFVTVFFLADSWVLLKKAPAKPSSDIPTQESFWTLQEKKLALKSDELPVLKLTYPEFNAWLSHYRIPPTKGFYLNRLRFISDKESSMLYISGSGFFLKRLVFRLELLPSETEFSIGKIFVNELQIPPQGLIRDWFLKYITSIAMETPEKILAKVINGRIKIFKIGDSIHISGDFMQRKKSTDAEIIPEVEPAFVTSD